MTPDPSDLPYAGLNAEAIGAALTALGVTIGPGADNPDNLMLDEHVPELLGALACLINGYTGMVTQAGITSHERAMWVKGYVGSASSSAPTGPNPLEAVFATVGTSLYAEAEAVKAAAPGSVYAHLAVDVLKLGATVTLFAGAIEDDDAVVDAELTTIKLKGMLAEVRKQLRDINGALGPVTRQLRRRGYDL
jgi:hypothetical protein